MRSRQLLNLRLIVSFDLWDACRYSSNQKPSIRAPPLPRVRPEIDRLPSPREKGSEEINPSPSLPPSLPFTFSLSVSTIDCTALRRETADSTVSPSPFTGYATRPSSSACPSQDPPRGFFDDQRRTGARGKERPLSLAEIIVPGDA